MKKITYLFTLLVAMSCQQKNSESATTTDTSSVIKPINTEANDFVPFVGADSATVACDSNCVVTYSNYTFKLKTNTDEPGETITVTDNMTKNTHSLVIKEAEGAQYFKGLVGNLAMIDAGTGNLRDMAIYDVATQKNIMYFRGIFDQPIIKNKKMTFAQTMDEVKVKSLKLPACKNDNLEWSGYTENLIFDFATKKPINTLKYTCIK